MTTLTFAIFLTLFLGVGLYSARFRKATSEDYLLASREIGPAFVGLSMAATLHSGFMFTGLIGFAYTTGVSVVWFSIGQILGQLVIWLFFFRRFREYAETCGATTFTQCLVHPEARGARLITVVSSGLIFVFLGITAAGQLLAGGKALFVVLGLSYTVGAVAALLVIIAYCLAGGIRASIWTDAVQAVVMMGALLLLVASGLQECGGMEGLKAGLAAQGEHLTSLAPSARRFGPLAFFLGWVALGLSWIGQPHFMVRLMALDDPRATSGSMLVYFFAMLVLQATAVGTGLVCRVVFPMGSSNADPEVLALMLAQDQLHPALVGVILAGLFAATVSTADSLVLACSAALTHDLFPRMGQSYTLTKVGTIISAVAALGVALFSSENVFSLVLLGVAAIGSSFGPLTAARACGVAVSTTTMIASLLAGPAAVLTWKYGLKLGRDVHEVFPGLLAATAVLLIGAMLSRDQPATISRKTAEKHA